MYIHRKNIVVTPKKIQTSSSYQGFRIGLLPTSSFPFWAYQPHHEPTCAFRVVEELFVSDADPDGGGDGLENSTIYIMLILY